MKLFFTKIYMCKKAGFLPKKAAFLQKLKKLPYKNKKAFLQKTAFLQKYIPVKKQLFYNRIYIYIYIYIYQKQNHQTGEK